jgi:hypothetical protein
MGFGYYRCREFLKAYCSTQFSRFFRLSLRCVHACLNVLKLCSAGFGFLQLAWSPVRMPGKNKRRLTPRPHASQRNVSNRLVTVHLPADCVLCDSAFQPLPALSDASYLFVTGLEEGDSLFQTLGGFNCSDHPAPCATRPAAHDAQRRAIRFH